MKSKISFILIVIPLTILLSTCRKDNASLVTTASVTDITDSAASCGGTVASAGGSIVISRGVCWSIKNPPTIGDSRTANGEGPGTFASKMENLNGNTRYFVRAYAVYIVGVGYGEILTFNTLSHTP